MAEGGEERAKGDELPREARAPNRRQRAAQRHKHRRLLTNFHDVFIDLVIDHEVDDMVDILIERGVMDDEDSRRVSHATGLSKPEIFLNMLRRLSVSQFPLFEEALRRVNPRLSEQLEIRRFMDGDSVQCPPCVIQSTVNPGKLARPLRKILGHRYPQSLNEDLRSDHITNHQKWQSLIYQIEPCYILQAIEEIYPDLKEDIGDAFRDERSDHLLAAECYCAHLLVEEDEEEWGVYSSRGLSLPDSMSSTSRLTVSEAGDQEEGDDEDDEDDED